MPYRPPGWNRAGYKKKPVRIRELALEGKGTREIIAALDQERPGSSTSRSEVSTALASLIKTGRLGSRDTRKPVDVQGVRYPTITDAAHAHGLSVEGVRKRIRIGYPGWRYAD